MEPGSWTDHGSVGVSSTTGSAYNAIDPNLILVGSTYYLNFGQSSPGSSRVPNMTTQTKES